MRIRNSEFTLEGVDTDHQIVCAFYELWECIEITFKIIFNNNLISSQGAFDFIHAFLHVTDPSCTHYFRNDDVPSSKCKLIVNCSGSH